MKSNFDFSDLAEQSAKTRGVKQGNLTVHQLLINLLTMDILYHIESQMSIVKIDKII